MKINYYKRDFEEETQYDLDISEFWEVNPDDLDDMLHDVGIKKSLLAEI